MKIGIRLSIYDDHDNELAKEAAWVPDVADLSEWRPTYDLICAALWNVIGDLVADARTVQAHNRGEPV